jgi:hypothetical protein
MKSLHHFSNKVLFVLLVVLYQAGLHPLKLNAEPKRTVFEGYRDCLKSEESPKYYVIQWIFGEFPKILAKGPIDKTTGKFKAVFEIDQNGFYSLFCTDKPIIIDDIYNYQLLNGDYAYLYLEPGDSLVIANNADMYWSHDMFWSGDIVGKGVKNKPFIINKFYFDDYPESFIDYNDTYINFWLGKVEKVHSEKIATLNKIKNEIPAGFYTYLLNNCKYAYYLTKFRLIVNYFKYNGNKKSENQAKLFDESDLIKKYHFNEFKTQNLLNDSFLNIGFYRGYVEQYVEYCRIQKELSGYKKTKFDIANEMLSEKTKEYYLASQLIDGLRKPDSKEYLRPFYEDFIKKYPNSDYSKMVSNVFNSRGDIGMGKPAPDFTLKDQNGKSIKLSSFKGRKVCISFNNHCLSRDAVLDTVLLSFKELLQIKVFVGHDTLEYKKMIREFPDVVKLTNYNWESAKAYNTNGGQAIYIIDEEGKILYYKSFEELEGHPDFEYEIYKILNSSKSSEKSNSNKLLIIILIIGSLLVAGVFSWVFVRWRSRLIRKREEKKRKLVEIELRGIRAQMNPHFMFNSLSSIQNLINQSKVQEANLYLSKFAELLRRILNNAEKPLVPIAEEIEAIRAYCELEQLRFDFNYSIEIDNNIDVYNTEIPGMLIQPYVENAIIHGINNLTDRKGLLKIVIKLDNSKLHVIIDDNGIGRKASKELKQQKKLQGNGFGLRLTQERLDLLNSQYKDTIEVAVSDKFINDKADGTNVEVRFSLVGLN